MPDQPLAATVVVARGRVEPGREVVCAAILDPSVRVSFNLQASTAKPTGRYERKTPAA